MRTVAALVRKGAVTEEDLTLLFANPDLVRDQMNQAQLYRTHALPGSPADFVDFGPF